MTTPQTILAYSDGTEPPGFSVEREGDAVVVSVPAVSPRRRLWLGAASVAAVFIGPVAAAFMLAAGMGWLGPLIVLSLILAPAVLLRLAVISAEGEPEGPEVVFRWGAADGLELRVRKGGGTWVKRWAADEVDAVRTGLLRTGLVVRAGGRASAEVMHWHPLKVRTGVARVLNEQIGSKPEGAHPATDRPVRRGGRRPRPF